MLLGSETIAGDQRDQLWDDDSSDEEKQRPDHAAKPFETYQLLIEEDSVQADQDDHDVDHKLDEIMRSETLVGDQRDQLWDHDEGEEDSLDNASPSEMKYQFLVDDTPGLERDAAEDDEDDGIVLDHMLNCETLVGEQRDQLWDRDDEESELEESEQSSVEVEADELVECELIEGDQDSAEVEADELVECELIEGDQDSAEVEADELVECELIEGGQDSAELEANELVECELIEGDQDAAEVEADELVECELIEGGQDSAEVEADELVECELIEGGQDSAEPTGDEPAEYAAGVESDQEQVELEPSQPASSSDWESSEQKVPDSDLAEAAESAEAAAAESVGPSSEGEGQRWTPNEHTLEVNDLPHPGLPIEVHEPSENAERAADEGEEESQDAEERQLHRLARDVDGLRDATAAAARADVAAAEATADAAPSQPSQPDDDTPDPSVDSRLTVVAVDDSPTMRNLVTMTLERQGYRVVTAADGLSTLNVIAKENPGLILMDINMPRLNGYKLCKLIRKHEKTHFIPVIMLSGKDGVFDKLRGAMAGCSDYITKPFDADVLVTKVARYLPLPADA